MFSSKYIFETRKTRSIRYLKNFVLIFVFISILYFISGYFFILFSKGENNKSREVFFQRPPDLIVVFTGDKGRISYAIEMAKEMKQSHIFITGVYSKNSVETLLNPLSVSEDFNRNFLEIDYLARNTVENAIATLRYLRKNNTLSNVLIISHDYHIPRIKTIMNSVQLKEDNFNFYYLGLESDFNSVRSLKILYTEVYKFLRSYLFLLIWNSDQDTVQIEL